MAYVRVAPWERGAAVAHPLTEQFVCPDPLVLYDEEDPLVKAHPWLFASDAEIAEKTAGKRTITEVSVPHAPETKEAKAAAAAPSPAEEPEPTKRKRA